MERPCTHGSRCPFGAGHGVGLPSTPALGIGQSTVGLSVTSCRTDEEGRSVQGRKDLVLVLASAGPTLRREGRCKRTVREPTGFPSGHNPASPVSTGMVSQGGSSWTYELHHRLNLLPPPAHLPTQRLSLSGPRSVESWLEPLIPLCLDLAFEPDLPILF